VEYRKEVKVAMEGRKEGRMALCKEEGRREGGGKNMRKIQ
jgi:hypothetical protein